MTENYWYEFCERLKTVGDQISHPSVPQDSLTRAEGYRYLTRLLRAGLDSCVEGADPRFPVFYSLSNDTIKIGNDNPDNYYLNCCISGKLDYVIEGEMGEVPFFSIATKSGSYATTGDMRPGVEITSEEIKRDTAGRFKIWLSQNRPVTSFKGHWLAMTPDSDNLIVRQYCNARKERPAQFRIRCVSETTPEPLNEKEFAESLARAIGFVEGTSGLFQSWINQFKAHTNQLPSNDQDMCIRVGGNQGIHYHNSHWQLAPDEALLVQPERIPDCEAWNFQISNYWMESLDYRHHTISINNQTAVKDKDGQIVIVVAAANPGPRYPNWLTTAGHTQGGMLFRWINAKQFPAIHTKVINLAELHHD